MRLTALFLALLPLPVLGFVVNISSSPVPGGEASIGLGNSAGTPINGALFQLGTFPEAYEFAGRTFTELQASFQPIGGNLFTAPVTVGPFSRSGLFVGSITDHSPAADAFNNKKIYLFAYNTATAEAASEFTIVSSTDASWAFPVNQGGLLDFHTISTSLIDQVFVPGSSIDGVTDLVGTVLIPEPRLFGLTAGLAGLAALLLRRRHRCA